jgi:hypothetical protein
MITCARRNKPDPSLDTPPAHMSIFSTYVEFCSFYPSLSFTVYQNHVKLYAITGMSNASVAVWNNADIKRTEWIGSKP